MSRTILAARRIALTGGAPVNTVPPSISGTVAHGSVLTATPGTWTGSPSITGQWYAGASPISGETGTTYTVDRAEGGFFDGIFYRETDSVGATSADSNALEYDYLVGIGSASIVHDMAEDITLVSSAIDAAGDQTANGNTVTAASSGVRPAYDAADADFAGQPAGTGDGVDDQLRIAATTLGGTFGPGALLLVAKLLTNVNGMFLQALGNAGARHPQATVSRVTSTFGAASIATGDSFTTQARCLVSVADGTNLVRYIDGTATGTPVAFTGTVASGGSYGLFAAATATAWSHCKIAFAAVTRTALTASQVADFGQYSRERWGTA